MREITIKGQTYVLGEIAGTVQNFAVLGEIMGCLLGDADVKTMVDMIPKILALLEESITAGSGAVKAKNAMADIPLKLSPTSELMIAVKELVQSLVE